MVEYRCFPKEKCEDCKAFHYCAQLDGKRLKEAKLGIKMNSPECLEAQEQFQ